MVDSYRAGPRAPPSWVPIYYFQQPTEGKLRQERSQVTPQHSVFLSPWISPAPHPPPRGDTWELPESGNPQSGGPLERNGQPGSPHHGASPRPRFHLRRGLFRLRTGSPEPRSARRGGGRGRRRRCPREPFVSVCTAARSPRGGAGGVLKVWSRFTNTPRFVTQQPSLQFAGVLVHCGHFPGRCDQVPQTGDQNRGVAGQGRAASRRVLPASSSSQLTVPCLVAPAQPSLPSPLLRVSSSVSDEDTRHWIWHLPT